MIQNLILLITGLVGFVTAGLIYKNYKLNFAMNFYIVIIIIIISIRFFSTGLIHFIVEDSFKSYYLTYSNFALIVIPLFYLYFKNLTDYNKSIEKKQLLHFIFPISFFIFLVNLDFFKINFKGIYIVLYTVFFLYVVFYIFLCYRLLKQNIWLKNETIKVVKKRSVLNSKWTYFLFLAIVFIAVRLLGSIYFELNFGGSIKGLSFQWISALIWLLILFKILVSPEILYGYDVLHKKIDENRNENLVLNSIWNINPKIQINNAQHLQLKEKIEPIILTYIEEIEKISLTEKIFRDSTITMTDLANKLNAPKSHISYLFKYHSTISFSEFKKMIRIQDAIKLINEGYLKENTLDYLSKKVGFPSYNTFFTSFKEISGSSPFEYCKTDKRVI
jgi:AraC-like DNA-binding protein